jgi:hypothetical protein
MLMVGIGLIVTLTVVCDVQVVPEAVNEAVMVNVVDCCVLVVFTNVPFMVEPLPVDAIPVKFEVLSRVQLKVVPATPFVLVLVIWLIAVPEQSVCVKGVADTEGTGLTFTVTVVVDEQPLAAAVIVNIVVCWLLVMFVKVPLIFPLPLAAMSVTFVVFVRVQVNVVPATLLGLVTTIVVIAEPEHIVCVVEGVANTVGTGFTVTVTSRLAPLQPFDVGTTRYVTVAFVEPVLVSV